MEIIPVSTQALLEADTLVVRDFMRISARHRATGAIVTEGFWSGIGEVEALVMDADTGLATPYTFSGVGSLIAIDPIPMVSNLTVNEIEVHFSQLDERVNELIRVYDVRHAKVEIYRAEFEPQTMVMLAPASSRFIGTVNGAPIETPAEGGEGSVKIKCVSSAQELTRSNPDTRSDESQQLRAPGDTFFEGVEGVPDLVIFWGRAGSVGNTDAGA